MAGPPRTHRADPTGDVGPRSFNLKLRSVPAASIVPWNDRALCACTLGSSCPGVRRASIVGDLDSWHLFAHPFGVTLWNASPPTSRPLG